MGEHGRAGSGDERGGGGWLGGCVERKEILSTLPSHICRVCVCAKAHMQSHLLEASPRALHAFIHIHAIPPHYGPRNSSE